MRIHKLPTPYRTCKINAYLSTVCGQVRWKKAHDAIGRELSDHIEDQAMAFSIDGMDYDASLERALRDMGDPVTVGTQFNRVYRPKPTLSVVLLTLSLVVAGFLFQLLMGIDETRSLVSRGVPALMAGLAIMTVFYYLDYTFLAKGGALFFCALIVGAVLLSAHEARSNAADTYTPYVLLLMPTAFSGLVYWLRKYELWGILAVEALVLGMILLAFHTPIPSGIMIVFAACLAVFTVAVALGLFGNRRVLGQLVIWLPVAVTLLLLFLSTARRSAPLWRMLDPAGDPLGAGWLALRIRMFLENSRFVGMGEAIPVMAQAAGQPSFGTNLLLTYLIYQQGWAAFIGLLALMLALLGRMILLSRRVKSALGRLVAVAVMATLSMQTLLYLLNNLGVATFPALPLPFVFSGDVSLMVNLALMGIMLSVFKSGQLPDRGQGRVHVV